MLLMYYRKHPKLSRSWSHCMIRHKCPVLSHRYMSVKLRCRRHPSPLAEQMPVSPDNLWLLVRARLKLQVLYHPLHGSSARLWMYFHRHPMLSTSWSHCTILHMHPALSHRYRSVKLRCRRHPLPLAEQMPVSPDNRWLLVRAKLI